MAKIAFVLLRLTNSFQRTCSVSANSFAIGGKRNIIFAVTIYNDDDNGGECLVCIKLLFPSLLLACFANLS